MASRRSSCSWPRPAEPHLTKNSCSKFTTVPARAQPSLTRCQGCSAERDRHGDILLRVVGRYLLSAVLGPELVEDLSDFCRIRDRSRACGDLRSIGGQADRGHFQLILVPVGVRSSYRYQIQPIALPYEPHGHGDLAAGPSAGDRQLYLTS